MQRARFLSQGSFYSIPSGRVGGCCRRTAEVFAAGMVSPARCKPVSGMAPVSPSRKMGRLSAPFPQLRKGQRFSLSRFNGIRTVKVLNEPVLIPRKGGVGFLSIAGRLRHLSPTPKRPGSRSRNFNRSLVWMPVQWSNPGPGLGGVKGHAAAFPLAQGLRSHIVPGRRRHIALCPLISRA